MNALEIAANAVMTVSVLLAARNNVHTWWTGIVGCALFGLLFMQARLHADATLQLIFIATSLAGWWWWVRGYAGHAAPVRRARPVWLAWMGTAALLCALGCGALLHFHTEAYAPFAGSLVLALSLLAQFLLVRRLVETWAVWLMVDTIAVPLFASRGLHLAAVLYAACWVTALHGRRRWLRELGSA